MTTAGIPNWNAQGRFAAASLGQPDVGATLSVPRFPDRSCLAIRHNRKASNHAGRSSAISFCLAPDWIN